MHSRLGLSKQIPPSCSGPRLPLWAPILLFSSAHLKHSEKEGSISHLHWGSQDMLWASRQGSGKAEHWKLFFQAEVKSTELCSTATVLGWQYFLTAFFVNVSEDLWVCAMGYSVWVLKHEHSVKQVISPRRNPWQICAVFFGAQPSKQVLLTPHELEVIPMCILCTITCPMLIFQRFASPFLCPSFTWEGRWHGAALAKDGRNIQGNNIP